MYSGRGIADSSETGKISANALPSTVSTLMGPRSRQSVYPKLSSIGFIVRISGADRMVWVMTGVKGLTDVCWGIPEVDAAYFETSIFY